MSMARSIRTLPLSIAAFLCLALNGGEVQAQTLTVTYPTHEGLSPRMSELHGSSHVSGPTVIHRPFVPPQAGGPEGPDEALQLEATPLVSATSGVSFDGMSVYSGGYIPSDNNIAVGPNHVAQVVNAAFAVYSKTGATLLAPVPLRNLWAGLTGSACAANNGGDPIVQYDRAADRWMVTQLGSLSSPYSQCIAISKTPDPTGAYYLYSYGFGSNLNDYPKFGVWPTPTNSAYLATYNLFANGASFAGAEICAYDRAAMLAGAASPAGLCFTGLSGASFLPVDLDGATPPLNGTPAYFMNLSGGSLGVYKLTPNFAALTATLSPFSTISVASYSSASPSPQPGTTRTLDALSDRLMYRLAFRMFADHEAIVVNHSVRGASGNSGVRWYELRSPVSTGGTFSLYQQGTFSPDSDYRWMGSVAMDQAGDIALGYSVSSSTTYPSVRYTGRTPGDTPGTMGSEASIKEGSGSQTGYSRWGDYSSMRIDPGDDCTFWYVNEYLPATSSYGWYTRIGSFKFSGCGTTLPDFSMSANPPSLTLTAGQSGNSTVTVTSMNGFSGAVGLLVGGCPANTSCTLDLNSVTPPAGGSASALLTLATSSITPAGTYTITITGTSGGLTHNATVTLTVQAPAGDFSMNLSATALTIKRGSSGSLTVSLGALGGSSSVTLSISGLPSKTSATFTPNPVTTSGSSVLKVKVNMPASTGTYYPVTIRGTNGAKTHEQSFTLSIN
jgi:hypothetical protein